MNGPHVPAPRTTTRSCVLAGKNWRSMLVFEKVFEDWSSMLVFEKVFENWSSMLVFERGFGVCSPSPPAPPDVDLGLRRGHGECGDTTMSALSGRREIFLPSTGMTACGRRNQIRNFFPARKNNSKNAPIAKLDAFWQMANLKRSLEASARSDDQIGCTPKSPEKIQSQVKSKLFLVAAKKKPERKIVSLGKISGMLLYCIEPSTTEDAMYETV